MATMTSTGADVTLGVTDSFWRQPQERRRMHVFADDVSDINVVGVVGVVGASLCGQQIKKIVSLREVGGSGPPPICSKCELLSR